MYDGLMNRLDEPESVSTSDPSEYAGFQNTQTAAGAVETQDVNSNQSLDNLWITTFIRSKNWKSKSRGFSIDGATGYAEFNNLTGVATYRYIMFRHIRWDTPIDDPSAFDFSTIEMPFSGRFIELGGYVDYQGNPGGVTFFFNNNDSQGTSITSGNIVIHPGDKTSRGNPQQILSPIFNIGDRFNVTMVDTGTGTPANGFTSYMVTEQI